MIPKIIHYCWLSDDPIPQKFIKYMESWKKYLPDYEFISWDTTRFDINSVPWVKQAFEAKKYAFAADYIRLYAIHKMGGIYLDMDVEVVKSFDSLLHQDYILGYEREGHLEAGIFGACKNAEWVKKCLSYYTGRNFIKEDGSYDTTVLPKIMYESIIDDIDAFHILPSDYLTAKSYRTGEVTRTKNTFSVHNFAGSWFDKEGRIRESIKSKLKFLPPLFRLKIAILIAKIRTKGINGTYRDLLNSINR